jgi:hypothetical protein
MAKNFSIEDIVRIEKGKPPKSENEPGRETQDDKAE